MATNQWDNKVSKKEMEIRRIRAVQMIESGKQPTKVAKEFGVSKPALTQWMKKFREKGWEGLLISNNHQRENSLNEEDIKNLKKMVRCKPSSYGYESDLWTSNMLRDTLSERFNKSVSQTTILRALKKTGIHIKSPRPGPLNGTWMPLNNG
jgi:transposase